MQLPSWAQLPMLAVLERQPPGRPPGLPTATGQATRVNAPWVVYSDRANNPTYRESNLAVKFKQLGFGEACYVLTERKGFLRLVKYDPKLKVGTFYAHRLLKSRKTAAYVGWVPKSQLLLANQAPTDSARAQPTLYCPALTSSRVLLSTGQYLRHDSLRLFAQPDLSGPLRKPLKIYDLAYIYKFSESGREALLGTADWFAPDSVARQLLGWAPTTALQALGQGWFMEPDTVHSAQADYQLYSSPTQAWQNKPDGQTRVRAFPAVPWASSGPRLPVLKSYNRDGQAVVEQLGLLTPLLDVSTNSILNVNGHRVTSPEAARWRDQARKYNVLYLLEDSPAMRPYWAELVSAIQATTVHLQDSTRRKIYRLGAVTYHKVPGERRASRQATPLTSDFADVLDKLEDHRFAESPEYNQPIREGFDLAFNLLSNHRGENNLIILVGISGDVRNITRMNSIYAGLQNSEARLLAFQVVAPPDTVANNFVLQTQQLVMQSALAVGKIKRERLASPRLVVPIPVYDLRGRTQNIYHLDFPKRSMVPGWVLFPTKRNKLPISLLLAATDSILAQLSFDAKQTQAALDRAFAV
ncbi:MAG: hypothetical protein EOO59_01295, partial [Hymenobacter sp.]